MNLFLIFIISSLTLIDDISSLLAVCLVVSQDDQGLNRVLFFLQITLYMCVVLSEHGYSFTFLSFCLFDIIREILFRIFINQ